MSATADLLLDARCGCAECPVWDPAGQVLWWTDIPGRTLHRLDPSTGVHESWPVPGRVGCFALREEGGLVVAMEHGFALLDPESGRLETLVEPEADRPENRFNDGRCDRRGRFFAGSMHEPRAAAEGALWRLDGKGAATRVAGGVLVANGLAWSPNDARMYWSDSRRGRVFVFDYDIESGEAYRQRLWMATDDALGRPDGAAVDAEGGYWSARFRGGSVIRFTPDGRIDRTIRLPVARATMCAFGGPDLTTLFITTAREGMSTIDLAAEPLAGGLFAVDAGIAGLPEPRYRG